MEIIKINFSDFASNFKKEDNFFLNLLKKKYKVQISENPDFLISSVYGMDFLKYNCVRILYTGENFTPDFNLFDYAIGFDWITFEDRYIRIPLYYIRNKSEYYLKCKQPFTFTNKDIENRLFCNFIYSNGKADELRTHFFYLLSKYKYVHSGGKYLNNIGRRIEDKLDFQRNFKFSIAFENSITNGYTTEKILEAKVAGTVPIYWGNPLVSKEMNTKAFINGHDYDSFEEVIERIKYLDLNPGEYLKVLNEPLIDHEIYRLNDDLLLNFLENIFQKNEKQRYGQRKAIYERKFRQYRIFEQIKRFQPINYVIGKFKI